MLKKRCAILRSPSLYSAKTHNRVIIAYCLLHNLIRQENALDTVENQPLDEVENQPLDEDTHMEDVNPISTIEKSNAWSGYRLAADMFNEFRSLGAKRAEIDFMIILGQ
ncbi:protein ALP1-like [Senna tora]|uniref:Protein ALP1-like n=1 Tax=Senna tora TaxID=362788 RepID=A0A834T788_9FABA|nr:protein ALP1-like [Senna tora]